MLASALGQRYDLATWPLDAMAFQGNRQRSRIDIERALAPIIEKDRWVVEGTLAPILQDVALHRASMVIWLDTPTLVAAARVLRRGPTWTITAVRIIVEAPRKRTQARRLMKSARATSVPVLRFRSSSQVNSWLLSLEGIRDGFTSPAPPESKCGRIESRKPCEPAAVISRPTEDLKHEAWTRSPAVAVTWRPEREPEPAERATRSRTNGIPVADEPEGYW
jgi:hypothetical protein